jgi:hypothetical protein
MRPRMRSVAKSTTLCASRGSPDSSPYQAIDMRSGRARRRSRCRRCRSNPVGVAFITGSVSAPGIVEAYEHRFPKDHPLRALAVSATTVRAWLRAAGFGRVGKRREMTWREFVRAHRQTLVTVDFFTVETIRLQRLYVLFFIELGSRRVHLAGCTPNPSAAWVIQQARQLSWTLAGALGTVAVSDSRSGSEIHRRF